MVILMIQLKDAGNCGSLFHLFIKNLFAVSALPAIMSWYYKYEQDKDLTLKEAGDYRERHSGK